MELTNKQKQVLALVAKGYTNQQIGIAEDISEHTAKYHVKVLCEKLGAATRAELVARAASYGLLVE